MRFHSKKFTDRFQTTMRLPSGGQQADRDESHSAPFSTRRLTLLAMLLCCAVVVGYVERSIPFDFAVPGVKLGLANVVILFALYRLKPGEVFILAILKCLMTAVFAGSFTALVYSICGAVLSFTAMLVMLKTGGNVFSPVGVSVIGAICHNIGQILAASAVLGNFLVVTYLPVLLISGVITGVLVGVVVKILLKNVALSKLFEKKR